MMPATRHIATLSQQFSQGRYDAMVQGYSFPLPIFVNRNQMVAGTADVAQGLFRALHGLILSRGFDAVSGRLISVEIPRRGRFRMWVEWSGVNAQRREVLFNTVCYNSGTITDHITQMFSLQAVALPEVDDLLAAA